MKLLPRNITNTMLTFFTLFLFWGGCTSQLTYVPFSDKLYSATEPDDILVFKNRLEISSSYEEIGVLMMDGNAKKELILKEAAIRGADGVVYSGNKIILVKIIQTTPDVKQESTDEILL